MPPNPSPFPGFRGYLIWPGQEPTTPAGADNRLFLGSEINIAIAIKDEIFAASLRIKKYQDEHGGECPPDLGSVSPTLAAVQEPWGGSFVFDRQRCVIYPSSYPDLVALVGRAKKL